MFQEVVWRVYLLAGQRAGKSKSVAELGLNASERQNKPANETGSTLERLSLEWQFERFGAGQPPPDRSHAQPVSA
jgi:hypothetical protein